MSEVGAWLLSAQNVSAAASSYPPGAELSFLYMRGNCGSQVLLCDGRQHTPGKRFSFLHLSFKGNSSWVEQGVYSQQAEEWQVRADVQQPGLSLSPQGYRVPSLCSPKHIFTALAPKRMSLWIQTAGSRQFSGVDREALSPPVGFSQPLTVHLKPNANLLASW